MNIILYSASERISVKLDGLPEEDERLLWEEITRGSDIVNGWTHGCARLINSPKTILNFNNIESKYKARFPQICRISHFPTNNVDNNAMFYVFNEKFINIAEKMTALEVLKYGDVDYCTWAKVHNECFHTWSILSYTYDIEVFGADGRIKKHIGGTRPAKDRVCRFCRKAGKTYKTVAHAIPEAIGNKILICDDECDDCNNNLEPIEKNFTRLMDFRRAMYRITRKNSTDCPTIYGKNYTIAPDKNGDPILYIKKSEISRGQRLSDRKVLFTFHHSETVIDQDVYRALVKMVIDVCPTKRLSFFQGTIDWIMNVNKEIISGALPSILFGVLPSGNFYNNPVLYLFFRKDDDITSPYCTAVLFITDVAYQFVIPFVEVDEERFKYDKQLETSRNRLNSFFNIRWETQASFSWWQSTIWNKWDVDISHKNIIFRPDNDPVFKRISEPNREDLREYDKMIFQSSDINIVDIQITKEYQVVKSNAKYAISQPLIINANVSTNECSLTVYLKDINNQIDFQIEAKAHVLKLNRFYCLSSYITGDTFGSLVIAFWRKMCRKVDRVFSLKLRKKDLYYMRNLDLRPYITVTKYEITIPNGQVIKTDYKSLVDKSL